MAGGGACDVQLPNGCEASRSAETIRLCRSGILPDGGSGVGWLQWDQKLKWRGIEPPQFFKIQRRKQLPTHNKPRYDHWPLASSRKSIHKTKIRGRGTA